MKEDDHVLTCDLTKEYVAISGDYRTLHLPCFPPADAALRCRRWEGMIAPLDHQNLAWVPPHRLRDYPMPPADEPLIPHLIQLL